MRSIRAIAIAAVLCGASVFAQRPAQFDAAVIKLETEPGGGRMKGGPGTDTPGRVTWQKVFLVQLLATAFHSDLRNISGPHWIEPDTNNPRYSFTATMPAATTQPDFELMLQAFLTEQFQIRLHHEPRLFPSYDLLVAPGGPHLRATAFADTDDSNGMRIVAGPPDAGGFPVMPPGHGAAASMVGGMHIKLQKYTMAQFAEYMTGWLTPNGDPTHYVTDKTGLTGIYDLTLKYDDRANAAVQVSPDVRSAMSAQEPGIGSGLPNVFRAMEQQLGLRLIKGKDVPKDTIVIDQASKMPPGS